jgi:hypothetical protein
MQIQTVTEKELALIIHGLRAICVTDSESVRRKLAIQLENEMSQRFGKMVGSWSEQERSTSDDGSFVTRDGDGDATQIERLAYGRP